MAVFSSYQVKIAGSSDGEIHHIVSTTIDDSIRVVDKFIHELLKVTSSQKQNDEKTVVGLAIEFCRDVDDDGSNTSINTNNKVATLQLCFGNLGILIQLLHLKGKPDLLKFVLANKENKCVFVGVGIMDAFAKLERDYEFECNSGFELGPVASRVCNKSQFFDSNLEELAREITMINIEKPTIPSLTLWDARDLRNEQIDYAITKFYASYRIGETLMKWKSTNK